MTHLSRVEIRLNLMSVPLYASDLPFSSGEKKRAIKECQSSYPARHILRPPDRSLALPDISCLSVVQLYFNVASASAHSSCLRNFVRSFRSIHAQLFLDLEILKLLRVTQLLGVLASSNSVQDSCSYLMSTSTGLRTLCLPAPARSSLVCLQPVARQPASHTSSVISHPLTRNNR